MSVSYTRIHFEDRVVQHSKAYIETENADETIDHTPAPGEIYQEGTKLNANIMNILDKGIDDCAKEINALEESTQQMSEGLSQKQDKLTIDSTPTTGSTNLVTSGGVKTELNKKQDKLVFDSTPTAGSQRPVTSGGVKTELDKKQNTLTFDSVPTSGSTRPVTSGGVYTALANKLKTFTANIPATGWTSQSSGAYYTINLPLSGILATDTPDIGIVQTGTWATDEAIRDAWACITRIVAAANQLQITADSIPGRAIPIQVRCIR